jgi:hypothetical protein
MNMHGMEYFKIIDARQARLIIQLQRIPSTNYLKPTCSSWINENKKPSDKDRILFYEYLALA